MSDPIDLKPGDYRVQTKNGRWLNRDGTGHLIYAGVICVGFIVYAWWHKSEIPLMLLVGTCSVACFAFGMVVSSWLKRFD